MLPIAPAQPSQSNLPTSRTGEILLSGAFWASAAAALALAFTPDTAPAQFDSAGKMVTMPKKELTPAIFTGVVAGVAGAVVTGLCAGRKKS